MATIHEHDGKVSRNGNSPNQLDLIEAAKLASYTADDEHPLDTFTIFGSSVLEPACYLIDD